MRQKEQQVPAKFQQYLDVMGKEMANALPEHRLYDCKINLKEEARHRGDQSTPYRRLNCKRSGNG